MSRGDTNRVRPPATLGSDATVHRSTRSLPPLAMWGAISVSVALLTYVTGVLMALVQRLAGLDQEISRTLLWVSGMPLVVGLALILVDVLVLAPQRRQGRCVLDDPIHNPKITVVLTAFNDAASIGQSVDDFLAHPLVTRVLVIDNNSDDATSEVAKERGAIVHLERRPGYGRCVHRALTEASCYTDTNLVALCEGDMTFRAGDLDKLVPYSRHAHVVNGTRIVEQLRSPETQLTSFMFYGNFVVAKALELKHLGRGTISDVGTTYKICRPEYLREALSSLDPGVNLEFNAHFLDRVLGSEFRLVEAPVTFHPRVGESKGGNTSNGRAALVGLRMMSGILLGWRPDRRVGA